MSSGSIAAGVDDIHIHIISIWMILVDLPGIHQVNRFLLRRIIAHQLALGFHHLFQTGVEIAAVIVFPDKFIISPK